MATGKPKPHLPLELLINISDFLKPHELSRLLAAIPCLTDLLSNRHFQYQDEAGNTLIHWIAAQGWAGLMKLILSGTRLDLDLDIKNSDGRTPLSLAAGNGHRPVVELLLKRNDVDPSSLDKDGNTPLIWAAIGGRRSVVKLLVERPEVNAGHVNHHRTSAVQFAAANGHKAVLKLLGERGDVNWECSNFFDHTPLLHAVANGHKYVVKQLLDRHSVNSEATDEEAHTILEMAAKYGHEEVLKLILERIRPYSRLDDRECQSRALNIAVGYRHWGIVELLRKRLGQTDDSLPMTYWNGGMDDLTRSRTRKPAMIRDQHAPGETLNGASIPHAFQAETEAEPLIPKVSRSSSVNVTLRRQDSVARARSIHLVVSSISRAVSIPMELRPALNPRVRMGFEIRNTTGPARTAWLQLREKLGIDILGLLPTQISIHSEPLPYPAEENASPNAA